MTLLFLIGGFPWITILIALLTFIVGYFLKGRSQGISQTDLNEVEDLQEKVRKLETDLKASQEQIAQYKKEINSLKSKSQSSIDVDPKLGSPNQDSEAVSEQHDKDQKIDESIAPPTIHQKPADQEQKEKSSKRSSKFEALKNDNLQIVEGIGPKMESVLKENGVESWDQLGGQTEETLRSILENYGNKYKIIDPNSWPEQAKHAAKKNWSQLVRLQKGLDAGRGLSGGDTPAKIEKVMVKLGILKMYKQDDLKAIEGIGPKIAELLNVEGITLWKQLAQTNEVSLQNILDKAGKRYQLADPSSWSKQAALADEGRFDELSDYQDILQGGV